MIVGYATWGNTPAIYLQSAFSALTFLADPSVESVCVATEQPQWYAKLSPRVAVIPVSPEQIQEWGGPDNYTYRRKIMGFTEIAKTNPGKDILFVDGDTFRGGPLDAVNRCIEAGHFGMHEGSGPFSRAKDSRNRKLFALFNGRSIAGTTITPHTSRLNAGAIAIPAARVLEALEHVLKATEEIHRLTGGYWASEEIAFNFALAGMGQLEEVSEGIGHYFGNKPQWTAMITEFFARMGLGDASLNRMIEAAAAFDFTSIPVFIHPPRRRRQLHRLADRFWPMTRPRYYPEKVAQW